VLQLDVHAKRVIEQFIGFRSRILCIRHRFFDTDVLTALRASAEAMTGEIHFVPRPKPTRVGKLWFFHVPSFPQAGWLGYPCESGERVRAPTIFVIAATVPSVSLETVSTGNV
jgi:hypothetical protein